MRSSKILILFLVGFLVFGSAAFFGYILFVKPYRNDTLISFFKKKPETPPSTKNVKDPSIGSFDAALALQNNGKILEAQAAWLTWLANYPNAPRKKEALILLGKVNMDLFSSPPSQSKENYTVIKGDSLDRIARQQKSNPELIQRLNNLPNTNLQIGEVLFVPELNTELEIDRDGGLVILKNHGKFLKCYPLLSYPAKGTQKKPPQTTTILDRITTSGNKRTAFGDKKYAASQRIILLRSGGNILTPSSTQVKNDNPALDNSSTTNNLTSVPNTRPSAMPAGFVISNDDMKEIFPFLSKETSVKID
jgi:LysM repeat protein